jgi:hypothetical protein
MFGESMPFDVILAALLMTASCVGESASLPNLAIPCSNFLTFYAVPFISSAGYT